MARALSVKVTLAVSLDVGDVELLEEGSNGGKLVAFSLESFLFY